MAKPKKHYGNGVNHERLTDRQRIFIAEYLLDMDAKRAAIAAGYSRHSAACVGSKMLNPKYYPLVARAIGNAQKKTLDALDLTRERVFQELAYCALRDPADLCNADGTITVDDLRKLPERIRRCIDSIKVKSRIDADTGDLIQEVELKLCPKIPSLHLAMQHFGMLKPQQINIGGRVTIDWDDMHDQPNGNHAVNGTKVEGTNPQLPALADDWIDVAIRQAENGDE